jgi:hypothetical protein
VPRLALPALTLAKLGRLLPAGHCEKKKLVEDNFFCSKIKMLNLERSGDGKPSGLEIKKDKPSFLTLQAGRVAASNHLHGCMRITRPFYLK